MCLKTRKYIIVLIILAGVAISLTLGENGIFARAKSIKEGTIKSIEATNGAILKESDKNTSTKKIFKVNQNGTYYFKVIADNGRKATTAIEVQGLTNELLNGGIKFNGGTMIVAHITQNDIYSTSAGQYTLAMRVKINREEQSTVRYMGLYGYHNGNQGISLQFDDTSPTINGINYNEYYSNWIDIVETYNNGEHKYYINGELKKEENSTKIPIPTFVIGNSYPDSINPRYMKGSISSVKVWSKELTESEIATLNMREKYTLIQDESIKLESRFR